MGNSLGGRKTTKVMKINGETMKFNKPVHAGEIVKDYPGHVLLDSEAVKHFGVRAKPLEPQQELKPKRLYFLVELPKFPEEKSTRRVRSGIQMSAKDRLESLMLTRRSVSDLSIMKSSSSSPSSSATHSEYRPHLTGTTETGGVTRFKMRLPKADVERLMMESKDEGEAAEKFMELCMAKNKASNESDARGVASLQQQAHCKGDVGVAKSALKSREKRVGFMPISEGEIHLVAAT